MKKIILAYQFKLIFLLLLSFPLYAEKKPKPNIVFFLVDDLGWSDVGCYGSKFHETPAIDQMAKEEGGRGSSFPRSLSLRSISPHEKIFAMWKMMIFMEKSADFEAKAFRKSAKTAKKR